MAVEKGSIEYPNPGQGVHLYAEGAGGRKSSHTAVVKSSQAGSPIVVEIPLDEVQPPVFSGDDVSLEYFRNGALNKLQSKAVTVAVRGEGSKQKLVVELALPDETQKVRMRQAPRLPVALQTRVVRSGLSVSDEATLAQWRGEWGLGQCIAGLAQPGLASTTEVVSASGARIRLEERPNLDEIMFVEMQLGQEPIRAVAKVVWTGDGGEVPGAGIHFLAMRDVDRQAVHSFVRNGRRAAGFD